MDDSMSDADHARTAVLRAKPAGQRIEAVRAVAHGRIQRLVGDDSALAVLGRQPRRRPDALDLAARRQLPGFGCRSLDTRRTSGSMSRR